MAPLKPRVFTDPETLFSLHVPPGWLVDDSGRQGTKVLLFHPAGSPDFRANVNVTVQNLGGLTGDEFLTLSRLQFKQLSGGIPMERDEPADRPAGAHLFEWSAPLGPLSLRVRQLIAFGGGKAFVLTATAKEQDFAALLPDVQQIVESFTLNSSTP
jgi:hypothetical protein